MRTFVTTALVVAATACWRSPPVGTARPAPYGETCGAVGRRVSIPMSTPFRSYESVFRPAFFEPSDLELATPAGTTRCSLEVHSVDDACHSTLRCEGASASALFPLAFVHHGDVLRVTSPRMARTWVVPMAPETYAGCLTLGEQRTQEPLVLCFAPHGFQGAGFEISVAGAAFRTPPSRTPQTPAL